MRPEEAIARRWGDIDWARRQILVQRVRTFKGSEWGDTKTYSERVVDLVEPALDALHAMKLLTMVCPPLTKRKHAEFPTLVEGARAIVAPHVITP